MNNDIPYAAIGNALEIIHGKKIPEGVQPVRDMALRNNDLKKRANVADQAAAGARAGVDAGFRRRDKKTRPSKDNLLEGQYDADNWKEAFDLFETLLEAKRKTNGKLPRGAIGEAFNEAREKKLMLKVTEERFRRKYYTDRGRPH
jgi:hypothetical protein